MGIYHPILSKLLAMGRVSCQKDKPSTSMSHVHVANESKLPLVLRSSLLQCPGNWVVIGLAVVYRAPAAQASSVGIGYRHCRSYFK